MSEEGEQILYNYLDTFKNLKRVRIFQKANYYNWRWCHATRWETRNITIDRETRSEYSSRIDRESSRNRARGRTEEVDGERRQTESKREEEENFQFCSTAGLPSGNFETNWLSRVYANRWALISSLGPLNPEAPWSRTGRKGEEREGERGWRISGSCTDSFHARSPKLLTNITILNTK